MGTVDPEWLRTEIRLAVLDVCKQNKCFPGDLEVDGLICISPCASDDQLVVKIHTLITDAQKNKSSSNENKRKNKAEELNSGIQPGLSSMVNIENDVDMYSEADNTSRKESKCWTIGEDLYLVEDGEFNAENDETQSFSKRRRLCSNGESSQIEQDSDNDVNQDFKIDSGENSLMTKIEPLHTFTDIYTAGDFKPVTTKNRRKNPNVKQEISKVTTNESCKIKEDEKFTCTKCETAFFSLGSMQYHVENDHVDIDNVNMLICRFCGKSYNRKDVLQHHVANHFIHNPYRCGVCGKTFCDKGTVYKHVKTQHKVPKVCFCSVCLTGYMDEPSLCEHKEKDCIQMSTKVCCPWCHHTAVNAVLMASHVISSHWQQINSPLKSELCT